MVRNVGKMCAPLNKNGYLRDFVSVLVTVIMLHFALTYKVGATGYGGLYSEKLIERQGTSSSSLVIGRAGTTNSGLDVAIGARCTTSDATEVTFGTPTRAKLNGNLDSLNGLSAATTWFEWGYDTTYGNTVGVTTMASTGTKNFTITGYNPSLTVHYRMVTETDGVYYGADKSFTLSSGAGTGSSSGALSGYNLIYNVAPVTIAAVCCLYAISRKSWSMIITAVIISAIEILLIRTILPVVWGG